MDVGTHEPADARWKRTGRRKSGSSKHHSQQQCNNNNNNSNNIIFPPTSTAVNSDPTPSSSAMMTTKLNGHHQHHEPQQRMRTGVVPPDVNYYRLLYLVLFAVVNLVIVYSLFVPLSRRLGLRMIWNLDDLRHTKDLLTADTLRQHWPLLLALYASIYIFNQTFIIPASVVMNCLAGATLGVAYGVPLVAILTASGASCSYFLSGLVGTNFIRKYFPNRLSKLEAVISRQGGFQLFFYLVALRIFPFTPNWFLNMSSPIVGIPFYLFYVTILIGLLPFHFVTVKAGLLISTLTSTRNVIETQTMLQFALVSIIVTIPPLLTKHKKVRKWLNLD